MKMVARPIAVPNAPKRMVGSVLSEFVSPGTAAMVKIS